MKKMLSALFVGALLTASAGCVQVTRTTEPLAASPTTTVVTPGGSAVIVQAGPWCGGAYRADTGSNFGPCSTTAP